ncbi:MAG: AAA family ATPase [Myxococcota bacterium]
MIISLKVSDIKSFKQAELYLDRMTLLVGANASGKSNLLEGIHLLAWLAQGSRLNDQDVDPSKGALSPHGTLLELVRRGQTTLGVGAIVLQDDLWAYFCELRVVKSEQHAEGTFLVSFECLGHSTSLQPVFLFRSDPLSTALQCDITFEGVEKGRKMPRVTCSREQTILTQLSTPSLFPAGLTRKQIPPLMEKVRSYLTRIFFLDPIPSKMRNYNQLNDQRLAPSGYNLSSVLYRLCQTPDVKAGLLEFIRTLPEQNIQSIDFLLGSQNDVIVALTETFGGVAQQFDAGMLSDGMLRILAMAAALYSVPAGSLVVMEELDNGIHPSRAQHLLAQMLAVAEERDIQVLLTTHSPALMDALPEEAVPFTSFCYRDPQSGESKLVRLTELEDYDRLMLQGSLGQLVTRGSLDRKVKNPSKT